MKRVFGMIEYPLGAWLLIVVVHNDTVCSVPVIRDNSFKTFLKNFLISKFHLLCEV